VKAFAKSKDTEMVGSKI